MLGYMKRFLFVCSGASSSVLMRPECAVEHSKYANIGALILITSVLATPSGVYAAYISLRSVLISIVVGLLWGVFVFSLDRYLVMTAKRDIHTDGSRWERFGRAFLSLLPRFFLMIFLGSVIAVPLELRLLQREIDAQVATRKSVTLQGIRSNIRQEFPEIDQLTAKNEQLDKAIAIKQADRDRLLGLAQDELSGKSRSITTAKRGIGPAYSARRQAFEAADRELDDVTRANRNAIAQNNERLKVLNTLVTTQQEQATRSVDISDGLVARLEALTMLVSQRGVLATVHYVLILLFVLLASGPILVIALT
jgi:hypothetical protein